MFRRLRSDRTGETSSRPTPWCSASGACCGSARRRDRQAHLGQPCRLSWTGMGAVPSDMHRAWVAEMEVSRWRTRCRRIGACLAGCRHDVRQTIEPPEALSTTSMFGY
jgi:hypothetical protein